MPSLFLCIFRWVETEVWFVYFLSMKTEKINEASSTSIRKKPDWAKIKKEYVSGATMRGLSRDYGVSVAAVSKRAHKEGWEQISKQVSDKSEQKLVEALSDVNARIADNYIKAVELISQKVYGGMAVCEESDSRRMREYMAILKDLKDIGFYRSKMDVDEQMARIDKLRKEATDEVKDATITVVMDDSLKDFAN